MSTMRRESRQSNIAGDGQDREATNGTRSHDSGQQQASFIPQPPSIAAPKGGGAIRGIGEKLNVNLGSGTASVSVPIRASAARGTLQPNLTLGYSSTAGNGPFGLGWHLSNPLTITRKTDKGLPRYNDDRSGSRSEPEDVFVLSGSEDLVPLFKLDQNGNVLRDGRQQPLIDEQIHDRYLVRRYSPRIEGSFMRIERWMNLTDPAQDHWRTISSNNETTIFGSDASTRIHDPGAGRGEPPRIFAWLAAESYDVQGNAMVFDYKNEDSVGVPQDVAHEENRSDLSRSANRYLKRIYYGNRFPNRQAKTWAPFSATTLPRETFMFSMVFDYGEHDLENPRPDDSGSWTCRLDPFSTFRSGFELRTYRLCRRILMFHHLEELGRDSLLVSSTDLTYDEGPTASYLASVTHTGYTLDSVQKSYIKGAFPPLIFEYSQFPSDLELSQLAIEALDQSSLENLPIPLNAVNHRWVDLDGEGIPGVLAEQGDAWYYKRNTSPSNLVATVSSSEDPKIAKPRLGALELLSARPSCSLSTGKARFGDVAGSGKLDLILTEQECWGYYERDEEEGWTSFQPFRAFPNLSLGRSATKLVDLTGDGLGDILIHEDQVFRWHPSCGPDGYGPAETITQPHDHEKGPISGFANNEQTIYLADISGDGLTDLVRIQNGEISYWPNCGHGKFGSRVVMDNAPWFDRPEMFDQKRILLADIDGSGTTDILYLGSEGVDIYLNQSGNSFSPKKRLTSFAPYDNHCAVDAIDLLGNGTACLVWSSALPGALPNTFQYLDIMRGKKPHLLSRIVNNLGSETRLHYASSTKFYLQDKEAGKPWLTRLAFPVHCIEKLESVDHISGNRFVSTYRYHHGFYDTLDREFRGFAMAEQWDAENYDVMSRPEAAAVDRSWHKPPIHTKTWFHTGAYFESEKISRQLAHEYYGAPGERDETGPAKFYANLLEDTVVSNLGDIGTAELREACRALKGKVLRIEVYGEDGSLMQGIPYSVQESNFTVEALQPVLDPHGHSVSAVHPRETLSFLTERNLDDPRIQHDLTLETDRFGNVLKSVKIAYGRQSGKSDLQGDDKRAQETTVIVYTESDYTNDIATDDDYRIPAASEARQYQLSGLSPSAQASRFSLLDFAANDFAAIRSLTIIPNEQKMDPNSAQRRLTSRIRTLFRKDDLTGLLPLGRLEPAGIHGASYKLAFTPGLIRQVYKDLIPDIPGTLGGNNQNQAGYSDLDNDGHWWRSDGAFSFHPDRNATAEQELGEARKSFYQPRRFVDPFLNQAFVEYDKYALLPVMTMDAMGNSTASVIDYRLLQPRMVIDANGNRNTFAYDALGMVAASAIMGKSTESLGDSLSNLKVDLNQEDVDEFFKDPTGETARGLLASTTSRYIYDLTRYWRTGSRNKPVYSATLSREIHSSEQLPVGNTKVRFQTKFNFCDGFDRSIQEKTGAGPGPLKDNGPIIAKRWIGSGWTIFNNKGKPVRKYEPFFDDTHDFKSGSEVGTSSTQIYDPVDRVVATLHANHTVEKTIFGAWTQSLYDTNDNVLMSDAKEDPEVGGYFRLLRESEYKPSWSDARTNGQLGPEERTAAVRTAAHANTPSIAYLDALGRTIVSVKDNGPAGKYVTRSLFDISGHLLQTVDHKGRVVSRSDYDMLGRVIHEANMDSGERWVLKMSTERTMLAWNSRGFRHRHSHDALQRLTHVFWQDGNGPELLVERRVYGESQTEPEARNLRGKVFQIMDQAGIVTTEEYDFKQNPLRSHRQLAVDYKQVLDWSIDITLELQSYHSSTKYDALDRPVQYSSPDNSVLFTEYNEAGQPMRISANLRGVPGDDTSKWTTFLKNAEYNARNQIILKEYGNGVATEHTYDPYTFRLQQLKTTRSSGTESLQSLHYVYDPAGNIVSLRDDAQQTIYFRNSRIASSNDYMYDAIYRLIQATGREHLSQSNSPNIPSAFDHKNSGLAHPGDGLAMGIYTESYIYDATDNLTTIRHAGSDASKPGWTRVFNYNEPSMIPGLQGTNNRLSSTVVGDATERYGYAGNAGIHGNMTSMPHLSVIEWDYLDRLKSTARQRVNGGTPETTYYVYDSDGNRVRKVTERQSTAEGQTRRSKERVYIGNFEIYREYSGDDTLTLERETLHVMNDKKRIALVETRTQGEESKLPARLIRYQLSNHQGSAVLELDETAQVISYEEYSPYGSTMYSAARSQTETPKRYKFTGKERDEESGFSYHEARYYAPWLARWTSCDPDALLSLDVRPPGPPAPAMKQNSQGASAKHTNPNERFMLALNTYAYAFCNPIAFEDTTGRQPNPYNNFETPVREIVQFAKNLAGAMLQHASKGEEYEIAIAEAQGGAQHFSGGGTMLNHIKQLEEGERALANRRGDLVNALNRLRAMGPAGAQAADQLKQSFKGLLDQSANNLRAIMDTKNIIAQIRAAGPRLTERLASVGVQRGSSLVQQYAARGISLIPEEIAEAQPGMVTRLMESIRRMPYDAPTLKESVRAMMASASATLSAYAAMGRAAAARAASGIAAQAATYYQAFVPLLEAIGSRLISVPIILFIPREGLMYGLGGEVPEA